MSKIKQEVPFTQEQLKHMMGFTEWVFESDWEYVRKLKLWFFGLSRGNPLVAGMTTKDIYEMYLNSL